LRDELSKLNEEYDSLLEPERESKKKRSNNDIISVIGDSNVIDLSADVAEPAKITKNVQINLFKAFNVQLQHTKSSGEVVLFKPANVELSPLIKCSQCPRSFSNEGNLANHMFFIHSKKPSMKLKLLHQDARINNSGSRVRRQYSNLEKYQACQLYEKYLSSRNSYDNENGSLIHVVSEVLGIPYATLQPWVQSIKSRDTIALNFLLAKSSKRGGKTAKVLYFLYK
jgi:hypothetical protein